jgi:hypothetical protein
MSIPPLAVETWPVMNADTPVARKATTLAISSARPSRSHGT